MPDLDGMFAALQGHRVRRPQHLLISTAMAEEVLRYAAKIGLVQAPPNAERQIYGMPFRISAAVPDPPGWLLRDGFPDDPF